MLNTIKKEWPGQVVIVLLIFFVLWWIEANLFHVKNSTNHLQLFTSLYGSIALWGAIWGIIISKKWGGLKSIMGKAILMFSLGLFLQEFGQLAYSYYYYIEKVAIPYPSLGDLGYFGSIPVYIYGTYLIAKASGTHFTLNSAKNQLLTIFVPLIMLVIAYLLFLKGYTFNWSKPLTIFLDFGYPFGEAIYISLTFLTFSLTRGMLGGIMRFPILSILFSLVIQFGADYSFLYQTATNTWVAGGTNDLIYVFSYTMMALSLIQFKTVFTKLQHVN